MGSLERSVYRVNATDAVDVLPSAFSCWPLQSIKLEHIPKTLILIVV